jgi:hypothetical protein
MEWFWFVLTPHELKMRLARVGVPAHMSSIFSPADCMVRSSATISIQPEWVEVTTVGMKGVVGVGVGMAVDVHVGVGVAVPVAVQVGVGVGVPVVVQVGISVGVPVVCTVVGVCEAVRVGVGLMVGVCVAISVGVAIGAAGGSMYQISSTGRLLVSVYSLAANG